jgi:hypothetical protein
MLMSKDCLLEIFLTTPLTRLTDFNDDFYDYVSNITQNQDSHQVATDIFFNQISNIV